MRHQGVTVTMESDVNWTQWLKTPIIQVSQKLELIQLLKRWDTDKVSGRRGTHVMVMEM